MDNSDIEMIEFLKEREARIGSRIIYRTYSLFYGSNTGEKREWGVFLYSDGKTFIFEDFDRKPRFLGIEMNTSKRPKYEKMEHTFQKEDVQSIQLVTRTSAEDVIAKRSEAPKPASSFARTFRKTLTEIRLKDGTRYYFELMDQKELEAVFHK